MLTVKAVAALNALRVQLPSVAEVRFQDEEGGWHVALPNGTGWMVDPPSACTMAGHTYDLEDERCSYCGEVLR